jgi:hypothetical protein
MEIKQKSAGRIPLLADVADQAWDFNYFCLICMKKS